MLYFVADEEVLLECVWPEVVFVVALEDEFVLIAVELLVLDELVFVVILDVVVIFVLFEDEVIVAAGVVVVVVLFEDTVFVVAVLDVAPRSIKNDGFAIVGCFSLFKFET